MLDSKVVVVIPALDEAENISRVVSSLAELGTVSTIVVDNGSTDNTAQVARQAGATVEIETRRGYGYACAAGVREALISDADIIVFMDGDGSSRASELALLLQPIVDGEADLVLGSRMRGDIEPGAMPAHQVAGNRVISWVMRLLYQVDVTDLGPFRAIDASLMRSLDMSEMTFGWPTEMMVKTAVLHRRIVEVPVSWDRRRNGESKVGGTLKGSILATADIVRVTLRYARKKRNR